MGKPSGSKTTIKGTRGDDVIGIGEGNHVYSDAVVAAGFVIDGSAGNDTLAGGSGPDDLTGGAGADHLTGGGGLDRLLGGDGDDILVDDIDGAYFDGGRGIDTLDLSAVTANVGVDLQGSGWIYLGVEHQDHGDHTSTTWTTTLEGRAACLENATLGSGNDLIIGNGSINILKGGGGNDVIGGRAGDDALIGGDGADWLWGEAGNDRLTGGAGADRFGFERNQPGHDVIVDFDKNEDALSFFGIDPPTRWEQVTVEGKLSLRAYFDGGNQSVTLLGITSLDGVVIL